MPKLAQTAAAKFSPSGFSGNRSTSEALKGFTDILIAKGNKQEAEDLRQLKRREAEDSRQRGIQEALDIKQLGIDRDKENYMEAQRISSDYRARTDSDPVQKLLTADPRWAKLSDEEKEGVLSRYGSSLGDKSIRRKDVSSSAMRKYLYGRGDMDGASVNARTQDFNDRLFSTAGKKQLEIMLKGAQLTGGGSSGRGGNGGGSAVNNTISDSLLATADDGFINNYVKPWNWGQAIADKADGRAYVGALTDRGMSAKDIQAHMSQIIEEDGGITEGNDFTGDKLNAAADRTARRYGTVGFEGGREYQSLESQRNALSKALQATVSNGPTDASVASAILEMLGNTSRVPTPQETVAADAYNKEKDGNTPNSIVETVAGSVPETAPQADVPPSIENIIPPTITEEKRSGQMQRGTAYSNRTTEQGAENRAALAANSLIGALGNAGSLWVDGATAVKDGVVGGYDSISDAITNKANSARANIGLPPRGQEGSKGIEKTKTGISTEENADIDSQSYSQDGGEALSEIMKNDLNSQNPDNVSKLENLLRTNLTPNTRGMVEQALKRLKQNIE